ncbi:MAG: hypothetical protein K5880_14575 [Hydrogenophaga sp.]|nr:hypothetical protein [Hydrogenophaga sp.]
MSKQQAEVITDLASYKEVTGAKRFKRTKDEMERRLTPEEALQERLAMFRRGPKSEKRDESEQQVQPRRQIQSKGPRRPSTSRKGDIVIRIRPKAGVDPEYFEQLGGQDVEVVMDEKWYSWVDTKLNCPYNGDVRRILSHIVQLGLGEVITTFNFEEDFQDHTVRFLDE